MKTIKVLFIGILLLGFVCAIAGCGGDSENWPIEGTARLQSGDTVANDGSYIDDVTFSPPNDGYVTVTMSSTDIDAYLIVFRGTSSTYLSVIGYDDDSGPGRNASYSFYATKDTTYTASFSTYSSGAKSGTYSYTIGDSTRGLATSNQSDSSLSNKKVIDNNSKLQKSP